MPLFQFNHRWTPIHQQPPSIFYYNNNNYNPSGSWTQGPYQRPPPYNAQPPPFEYKPAATTSTFEIDDPLIPESRKEPVPAYRRQTFQQRWFGGLKRTLRLFAALALVILIINLSWLAYAYTHYSIAPAADGHKYGTLRSGDCNKVKQVNTWLHLAINLMSTFLLTGSNAFMAAYSGPTREEVNVAHAEHKWLHIGSMSLRNILGVSKRKSLVVLLLALSSAPFHLLYNSLVFSSLAANNYYWAVVTEDFVKMAPFNLTVPTTYTTYDSGTSTQRIALGLSSSATLPDDSSYWYGDNQTAVSIFVDHFNDIQKSVPTWERLDPKPCIQAYSNAFLSGRRNVVLVSSTKNDSNSVLQYDSADLGTDLTHNWWICSGGHDGTNGQVCNPEDYAANASSWTVYDNHIEYCLSEKVEDVCTIKFSLDIMFILLGFNTLKVVAMVWVLFRIDAEHILTSIGDAAASFIREPDPHTFGICLANKRRINSFWREPGRARFYDGGSYRRWGRAISKKRWTLFFIILFVAFSALFFFGVWGFSNVSEKGVKMSFSNLWNLGFGSVSQYAMAISGGGGNVIVNAILANLPQVIIAMVYLIYQGIVTAMFNAADWANFAFAPQTLMVSTPVGTQRGTWLLGAPVAYGLPILGLQILLHWFVSQSIFVVQFTIYNKLGQPTEQDSTYSNCGYSPIAMICSTIASVLLCMTAVFFMMRTTPVGAPPIVSSCSAAISAACHVPVPLRGHQLVYSKLRWGATDHGSNGVGHCSLGPAECWNTGRACPPVSRLAYAGIEEEE